MPAAAEPVGCAIAADSGTEREDAGTLKESTSPGAAPSGTVKLTWVPCGVVATRASPATAPSGTMSSKLSGCGGGGGAIAAAVGGASKARVRGIPPSRPPSHPPAATADGTRPCTLAAMTSVRRPAGSRSGSVGGRMGLPEHAAA